jgi:lipoprotein-anchoring transpeptidase ErfK/SrfK
VAATLLALLGGTLYLVTGYERAADAARASQQAKVRLANDVKAAQVAGYTDADLAPILVQIPSLDRGTPPPWPSERTSYYERRAALAQRLDRDLGQRQAELLDEGHADAQTRMNAANAALDHGRQIGVDDVTLAPLQQRLDGIRKQLGAAQTITQFRTLAAEATALQTEIANANVPQERENQVLAEGAAQLRAQAADNVDAMRSSARAAVAGGNNEATIAAFLNKPSAFDGWVEVATAYGRMQRAATKLAAADPGQVAISAFAAQRYAGQIHDALLSHLPPKAVLISSSGQHLSAYEGGRQVASTPITSGTPPDLATDIGPMKVLRKDSPWKMHSPWPKGSPYWYPDANVQMVIWFTNTGEGLHDADWQPCCWGPGSQFGPYASHGCIHVPIETERFLFSWTAIGTPVVMYPGDGQPLEKQLAQMTTDDQGRPFTGPKGA